MKAAVQLRQRGATLVECCLVAAIAMTAIGVGAPGFLSVTERRHLTAAAAQLETDIHFARSMATAANQSVRISFTSGSALACYVIHTGAAGACQCVQQGQAQCGNGATVLRTVSFTPTGPITLQSNSSSMLLDAANGTVTPTATVQVRSRSGETLKVIVNIMGRVRSCAATPGLPGYKAC
jgi:type IV fimbrial biogenesis protein FimT